MWLKEGRQISIIITGTKSFEQLFFLWWGGRRQSKEQAWNCYNPWTLPHSYNQMHTLLSLPSLFLGQLLHGINFRKRLSRPELLHYHYLQKIRSPLEILLQNDLHHQRFTGSHRRSLLHKSCFKLWARFVENYITDSWMFTRLRNRWGPGKWWQIMMKTANYPSMLMFPLSLKIGVFLFLRWVHSHVE